jgi:hypothetical protein
LEAKRQQNFRQAAGLRLRSERAALAWVNQVGVCSTFYRFPEGLPCLWEAVAGRRDPRWPRRSHHDPGIGFTWELKETLAAKRQVYYGKLLKGRPLLVALDVFPAFYALVRGRQRARDYRREYEAGRLSLTARRIMDALGRRSPQYTRALRAECFMLEPAKTRPFERAMAELQQGLWVLKTEERYEPTFSYAWDLVERWLAGPVREGRRLARPLAAERLIARYLRGAVYATPEGLSRLFPVSRAEVDAALTNLQAQGAVDIGVAVPGWAGHWVVAR